MLIKHAATAGTIESSDVMVMIEPAEAGIEILLESPVLQRYGRQIRQVTAETLRLLKVENAKVSLVERGALDCTIRARVECAVYRAADAAESGIAWGGTIE